MVRPVRLGIFRREDECAAPSHRGGALLSAQPVGSPFAGGAGWAPVYGTIGLLADTMSAAGTSSWFRDSTTMAIETGQYLFVTSLAARIKLEPKSSANRGRRGRPATASREDVLRLARAQFLEGRRVDLTVVARELGLGRATIYRWFGSREAVLGEVIVDELQQLLARHRQRVRQRGAAGLLEVFDRVNRGLSRSQPLRRLVEQEREGALRLLTSGAGPVQERAVAAIQALIDAEVASGRYQPPADTGTLAYAIVRLADGFLYNDAAVGIRGDWERLRQVEAALLGIPATPGRGPARKPRAERGAGKSARQAHVARPGSGD